MPRPALGVAAPALAIALALTASACRRGAPSVTPPKGDVGAMLAVPTRAGAPFDPATLDGKPALVVFWRPGCPYCREELPEAVKAAADRGATLVGVQIAEGKAAGEKVLTEAGWNGVDLVDDGTLRKSLDLRAVPYTLVLRPDGTAARAYVGRKRYGDLRSALAAAK